jgi:hypothetical protein
MILIAFIVDQWSVLKNDEFVMVYLNENRTDLQGVLVAAVVDDVTARNYADWINPV